MRDQVTHDPGAHFVASALTEPQSLRERAETFVATTSAQAREAVVHPERGVGFDGKTLFAQDQHGATLVTAFGLTASALEGSDCRLAGLFDEVAHDANLSARDVPERLKMSLMTQASPTARQS
jgi:hypothetical protein